jgi:hypothetical protein
MEVGTKQSKTAVNANAAPAQAMEKLPANSTPGQASVEDLGGPTPDNYKPDNDSAKLKDAAGTLKQVKDVVTKNAEAGDKAMPTLDKKNALPEEEQVSDESVIEEEETTTDEVEVVAEEETTEEVSVEEDVEALLQGEELSEEFQAKAKTIFEAAINSKVAAIVEELEADHIKAIKEETEELRGEVTERVDSYLEYVADEWLQENKLAVDQGLKSELSESFMTGMKSLFEEHYVSIPEDKYDVLESMVNKLDDMEEKLNEQIDKNVNLTKRLSESKSDGILSDVSEGLAVTQKDKLASLAESVEFETENDYREKLVTLRNSYFPTRQVASTQSEDSEMLSESKETVARPAGSMDNYLTALQRITKK